MVVGWFVNDKRVERTWRREGLANTSTPTGIDCIVTRDPARLRLRGRAAASSSSRDPPSPRTCAASRSSSPDRHWTRGRRAEATDRTIDVQVSRLRKKIETCCDEALIKTVRNAGYTLSHRVEGLTGWAA